MFRWVSVHLTKYFILSFIEENLSPTGLIVTLAPCIDPKTDAFKIGCKVSLKPETCHSSLSLLFLTLKILLRSPMKCFS